MSFSRSRKPKMKWTNQMNNDVLECKRRAQELVASDGAPLNRNGRKKGYIEIMKQLWEEKGYGHLALKGQNLRDQASRLEKCQEGLADESCVNGATVISIDESILSSDTVVVEGNRKKGDDYATTISWIRAKVSFAILRSALLCLRGTRRKRRPANISDIDITSESAQARI